MKFRAGDVIRKKVSDKKIKVNPNPAVKIKRFYLSGADKYVVLEDGTTMLAGMLKGYELANGDSK